MSDLAKQLMSTYLEELHDHVSSIGRDLLALEKATSPQDQADHWATIFRSAHTLKGASAIVDAEPIRVACHHMEDIFGHYRDHQLKMPEETTSTMLKVVDAFEEIGSRLRTDDELEGATLFELLPELERLAAEAVKGVDPNRPEDAEPIEVQDETADTTGPIATPQAAEHDPQPTLVDQFNEHVKILSQTAIALEDETEPSLRAGHLDTMIRATEQLKTASVDQEPIQNVSERLSGLLMMLRRGELPVTSEVVSRILETSDAILDAGRRAVTNRSLQDAAITKIPDKLNALINLGGNEAVKQKPEASVASDPTAQKSSRKRPSTSTPETSSVRVSADKLDALLAHNGELLVARGRFDLRAKSAAELRDMANDLRSLLLGSNRLQLSGAGGAAATAASASTLRTLAADKLSDLARKLDSLSSGMETDNRQLGQTCRQLDQEVYHVRMLPFSEACGGLQRAARDIATATNKVVTLRLEGADVEVDRSVLEGLKDPLLHLVRNAVDHGIESPEDRTAIGKPAEATITVSASLRGGQVEVVVSDDGAGLDLHRIRAIAEKRGIDVPDDPREQARLVFAPGFSTAKLITDISGRGVGLDVVQNRVESLHGDVEVNFTQGEGTQFTLVVPLTLTTIRCMLVSVAEQVFAIPNTSIKRLVRFSIDEIRPSAGRDTLLLGNAPTALVSLADTIGLKSENSFAGRSKALAVVLAAGEQRVAVVVDEVKHEQEVLVKNLGRRIRRLRHFSGCTLLPTGQIALVMNAANVVRSALGTESRISASTTEKQQAWVRKQVLLADDSVTTRMLLKNILEANGYDVVDAVDGRQAWELAAEQPFDAVVSDVDMPHLDGFELTEKLRGQESTCEIPVVLVSARGTDRDKAEGVRVGASAYIVKGTFDQQNLIETLAQLV